MTSAGGGAAFLTVPARLLVAAGESAAVVLLVQVTGRADAQVAARTLDASAAVRARVVGAQAGQCLAVPSRVSQRAVAGVITLLRRGLHSEATESQSECSFLQNGKR